MLIVLEGANGTGKTTTAKELCEKLTNSGVSCEIVKYPDYGTGTGELISSYLKGDFGNDNHTIPMQAAMYALDRSYGKGKLFSALNRNRVVILDRYVYSNTAIMGAMSPEHLPVLKNIANLEFEEGHLPQSDHTFLLDLDDTWLHKSMCERKEERDIHESDELNTRIAKNYRNLSEDLGWINIQCASGDKRRTPSEIAADILYVLQESI